LDKLYTEGPTPTDAAAAPAAAPPPPGGGLEGGLGGGLGEPPPPPPPGGPEPGLETASVDKKFNLIFESELSVDEYFDLKKGNKSIDDLNEEFNKLLND